MTPRPGRAPARSRAGSAAAGPAAGPASSASAVTAAAVRPAYTSLRRAGRRRATGVAPARQVFPHNPTAARWYSPAAPGPPPCRLGVVADGVVSNDTKPDCWRACHVGNGRARGLGGDRAVARVPGADRRSEAVRAARDDLLPRLVPRLHPPRRLCPRLHGEIGL